MDEQEIQRMYEEVRELAERFGITTTTVNKFNIDFTKLDKQIKDGTITYKDLARTIKQFDSEIDDLNESFDQMQRKQFLREQRAELQQRAQQASLKEATKTTAKGLLKAAETATKGVGQVITGLQTSGGDMSSGLRLSTNIAKGAIDTLGGATGALGSTIAQVGAPMALMPGYLKAVGIGLTGLGAGLSVIAEKGSALAKFGLEVLSAEVDRTIKSFNLATRAGAVFSDGMQGLRQGAVGAELTVEQFSNVIGKTSQDLSLTGLGVTDAARQVGQVGSMFASEGGRIRKQLLALGYTFEEQAELTAEVMGNIRRSGGTRATAEQIATETREYAENLRLISSITGEDARAKQKQVQEQNMILAFQNEVAQMSVTQRAQLNMAMQNLSEVDRKALRDRIITGGNVITQEAAIAEALNRGAREQNEAIYNLVQAGNATAETVLQVQSQFSDSIREGVRANQAVATAAYFTEDQLVSNFARAELERLQITNRINEESFQAGMAGVQGQKTATDELTQGVVRAAEAAQRLAVDLQDILLPAIRKFSDAAGDITTAMADYVRKFTRPSLEGTFVEQILPPATNAPISEQLSYGLTAPYMTQTPRGKDVIQQAEGGVVTGPKDGYPVELHGTEAVVPLPDGRNIPVNVDTDGISKSITTALAPKFDEMIAQLRQNNRLTGGILNNSY